MSEPQRTIPLRELRNDVSRVLKDVESGKIIRVTVDGRPVADLVPVQRKRMWVPWPEIERIIVQAPLDPRFRRDVEGLLSDTTDELLP